MDSWKPEVNGIELTNDVISCGPTFVCATKALGAIQPTGPFERALVCLLVPAYKCRLRAIVEAVLAWASEEILSASEHIGDDRAVLWVSKN